MPSSVRSARGRRLTDATEDRRHRHLTGELEHQGDIVNPDSWAGLTHARSIARRKKKLIEAEKVIQQARDSYDAEVDKRNHKAASRMEERCANRDLSDHDEVREIINTELSMDTP